MHGFTRYLKIASLIGFVTIGCGKGMTMDITDMSTTNPDLGSADLGMVGAASCAFTKATASGTLCAVRPSSLRAGVSDTFGYHALGVPKTLSQATPVYVHLVGSGGDPARAETQSFPNETIMEEAMAKGYLVLLPAYDNEPAVGSTCKTDLPCYEAVRREVLSGIDAPAPYGMLKDVRPPNHLVGRFEDLVAGLLRGGILSVVPSAIAPGSASGPINYGVLTLGGHSQGGGHVGLLAKDRLVRRVCMLSSPIDGAGQGMRAMPVPWVSGNWQTPLGQRRAVIHQNDDGYDKTQANFNVMGMVKDTHYRLLTFATAEAHSSTVKGTEPDAVAARAWACFSN